MYHVTIKSGVKPVLQRLESAARDATPVFRDIGQVLLSVTQGNFYKHGANYRPIAWAPKKDGSACSLKKTGRLSASLVERHGAWSATVSTDAPYAAIHQFGADRIPTQVPEHARLVKTAFGKTLPFGVWSRVSAHTRHMSMPMRPFFPIEGHRLTPAAQNLVVKAANRAFQQIAQAGKP